MMLGIPELAGIWTGATIVGTALFWGVLLLGRLTARLERVEGRQEDLTNRMDRAGERLSDFANEVQKIPDTVRREVAIARRGSHD